MGTGKGVSGAERHLKASQSNVIPQGHQGTGVSPCQVECKTPYMCPMGKTSA